MEMKEKIDAGMLNASMNSKASITQKRRMRILSPFICSVCASVGIFGGIAALIIGSVFVVIHAVVETDQLFDRTGTALLIVAIPAILLGSVFLDVLEGKSDSAR